jgi:hypothetical protein
MGAVMSLLFSGPALGAPVGAQTEQAVRDGLGLYLSLADRRDEDERMVLRGGQLELWFLEPLADDRARRACDGLRWLMAGRLGNSMGARGVFAALPEVERLMLVFYRVQTEVAPDETGRYSQQRTAVPVAKFAVARAQAARLDPKVLRKTLHGARCLPVGRQLLDEVWVRR